MPQQYSQTRAKVEGAAGSGLTRISHDDGIGQSGNYESCRWKRSLRGARETPAPQDRMGTSHPLVLQRYFGPCVRNAG